MVKLQAKLNELSTPINPLKIESRGCNIADAGFGLLVKKTFDVNCEQSLNPLTHYYQNPGYHLHIPQTIHSFRIYNLVFLVQIIEKSNQDYRMKIEIPL